MDRINAMRLFSRLVERGSFSAAARDLRIKQSTASKWVAELEEQLGVSLVERTTRALRITPAGNRFHAGCIDVLGNYDELTSEIQNTSPEPSGKLRVSLPVVFGVRFAVPLLADFLRRFPKVSADLALSDRYVNLVEEGFDLALRVGTPVDTSARGHKLSDGGRHLVAAPSYIQRRGKPTTPDALRAHTCLLFSEVGAGTTWQLVSPRGESSRIHLQSPYSANNAEVLLELANQGMGIALLADWLVHEDVRRKRLVRLLPTYSLEPAPIYALTPGHRYTSVTVRLLIQHLREGLLRSSPRRAPRASSA